MFLFLRGSILRTVSAGLFLVPLGLTSAPAYESIQLRESISPSSLKAFSPVDIAIDPRDRIWVVDSENNQLILLSATGELLETIGSRGPAPGQFSQPKGLAIDQAGHVYVADSGNHRIQVLSPDGKPVAVFGRRGSQPGEFQQPSGVAVSHDGIVIVADRGNQRLQLLSPDGVFLTRIEVASDIDDVAVDAAGRIYTTHPKTRQIEQWSAAGQHLHTFTGIEPGVKGFQQPSHIAAAANGLLYVTDQDSGQFREMAPNGRTLGTFGKLGKGAGQFKQLSGILATDETVWVCDPGNRRIDVYTLTRPDAVTGPVPIPTSRLQVRGQGLWPVDTHFLATDPKGEVAALSLTGELQRFSTAGKPRGTAQPLKKLLGLRTPSALAIDRTGRLFVADSSFSRIFRTDAQGLKLGDLGQKDSLLFKSGQGELSRPSGLSCSAQGTLFVADTGNGRIQAFNEQGLFLFGAGEKGTGSGQLKTPTSVAWDRDQVYVADTGNRKIVVFNPSGRFIREFGVLGPEPLVEPKQVMVDSEGNVFVLDAGRGRVLAYDSTGVFLGGFGSPGLEKGFLNRPRSFALNAKGELFIAEEKRIQKFSVSLLPPAPTGLKAKSGEGFVELRWTAVKTRSPASYVVYRSSPMAKPKALKEITDTVFTDDTLTPQTTYTYSIVTQVVQGVHSVPSVSVLAMALPSRKGPELEIVSAVVDDIFSAHYKYYGRVPVSHVRIRHNGQSPFQNVKVSFAIQGYMDYPSEAILPELRSSEEKEVALPATFNNRILEVTETTPIQAQLKLSYFEGSEVKEVTRNLPFKLYSRNTIRWDKKERFAGFVTPNDPPVIDFARGVVLPFYQAHRAAPVPSNVITAWTLFEGLGVYGISYVPRPNNPYDRVSLDSSTVDSMQFARETLARKSGDCADVVGLLASALESLTVTTVALDAPGHLFIMFDTGESNLERLGFPADWVVSYAGSYWIPLEATMLGSPFMEAWKKGAEQYRLWNGQGKIAPIDIHMAWRTYEPATLPETASIPGMQVPTREAIEEKFLTDWKSLVELRWQTSIKRSQELSAKNPTDGNPWLSMGLLAAEFKRFEEAKKFLAKATTDKDTAAAAHNNLGNIDYVQGNYPMAETQYEKALTLDPGDAQIGLNLARTYLKQKKTGEATQAFETALKKDPSLRERYPDVSALIP